MIHELFAALIGFSGNIIVQSGDSLGIRKGFHFFDVAESDQVNKLISLSNYYNKLKHCNSNYEIANHNSNVDVYKLALYAGISENMDEYLHKIAYIENMKSMEESMSICDVIQKLDEYFHIMPALLQICEDIERLKIEGCQLLDYLHKFKTGVPPVVKTIDRLLNRVQSVFYRQVMHWMIYGHLDTTSKSTFFITCTLPSTAATTSTTPHSHRSSTPLPYIYNSVSNMSDNHTTSQYKWNSQYILNMNHIPLTHINTQMASKILFTGKTAALLSSSSSSASSSSSNTPTHSSMNSTQHPGMSNPFNNINNSINRTNTTTSTTTSRYASPYDDIYTYFSTMSYDIDFNTTTATATADTTMTATSSKTAVDSNNTMRKQQYTTSTTSVSEPQLKATRDRQQTYSSHSSTVTGTTTTSHTHTHTHTHSYDMLQLKSSLIPSYFSEQDIHQYTQQMHYIYTLQHTEESIILFENLVNRIHTRISTILWNILCEQYNILQYFQIIRNIYLLGKGEFYQNILDQLLLLTYDNYYSHSIDSIKLHHILQNKVIKISGKLLQLDETTLSDVLKLHIVSQDSYITDFYTQQSLYTLYGHTQLSILTTPTINTSTDTATTVSGNRMMTSPSSSSMTVRKERGIKVQATHHSVTPFSYVICGQSNTSGSIKDKSNVIKSNSNSEIRLNKGENRDRVVDYEVNRLIDQLTDLEATHNTSDPFSHDKKDAIKHSTPNKNLSSTFHQLNTTHGIHIEYDYSCLVIKQIKNITSKGFYSSIQFQCNWNAMYPYISSLFSQQSSTMQNQRDESMSAVEKVHAYDKEKGILVGQVSSFYIPEKSTHIESLVYHQHQSQQSQQKSQQKPQYSTQCTSSTTDKTKMVKDMSDRSNAMDGQCGWYPENSIQIIASFYVKKKDNTHPTPNKDTSSSSFSSSSSSSSMLPLPPETNNSSLFEYRIYLSVLGIPTPPSSYTSNSNSSTSAFSPQQQQQQQQQQYILGETYFILNEDSQELHEYDRMNLDIEYSKMKASDETLIAARNNGPEQRNTTSMSSTATATATTIDANVDVTKMSTTTTMIGGASSEYEAVSQLTRNTTHTTTTPTMLNNMTTIGSGGVNSRYKHVLRIRLGKATMGIHTSQHILKQRQRVQESWKQEGYTDTTLLQENNWDLVVPLTWSQFIPSSSSDNCPCQTGLITHCISIKSNHPMGDSVNVSQVSYTENQVNDENSNLLNTLGIQSSPSISPIILSSTPSFSMTIHTYEYISYLHAQDHLLTNYVSPYTKTHHLPTAIAIYEETYKFKIWMNIQIHIKIPSIFCVLFDEDSMSLYNKLFNNILKAKLIAHALERLWRMRTQSLSHNRLYNHLRYCMHYFISTLLYYWKVDIIDGEYHQLMSQIHASTDFQHIYQYHRIFLANLAKHSFLENLMITQAIEKIYICCIRFIVLCRLKGQQEQDVYSYQERVYRAQAQATVSSIQQKQQRRHFHTRTSYSEQFPPIKDPIAPLIIPDQELIAIKNDYVQEVDYLFKLMNKLDNQQFLLRLDYNGYFSKLCHI